MIEIARINKRERLECLLDQSYNFPSKSSIIYYAIEKNENDKSEYIFVMT